MTIWMTRVPIWGRYLCVVDTEHPFGAGFDPPPPAVSAQGAMTSE